MPRVVEIALTLSAEGLLTRLGSCRAPPFQKEINVMKKFLAVSAIAGAMLVAIVADANAGSRSGTITGPRGTTTFSGSRSCAGGTCSSQGSVTGPYGNTVSRQGSSSCSGGSCSGSGTVTGPRGGTVSYNGTVTR
jgi:hypothetical protein